MDAVLLALASLLCAAINDVVFRIYGSRGAQRNSGSYIAVIGAVWVAVFAAAGTAKAWGPAALTAGAIAGLCGAAANMLLVEAMARSPAAMCSTIYRLNLVPAAILAVLLLGEPAGMWIWIGVAVASAAVLACFDSARGAERTGILLVCGGALARAGMALAMKVGATAGAAAEPTLAIAGAVWLAAGWLWGRRQQTDRRTIAFGAASGVLTAGVVLFLFLALACGPAALVIPISQLSFALTALLAWPLLGERPRRQQLAGLGLATIAIICFSQAL